MKLHTDGREVLKGGVSQESTFTIKATGKAFQVLSSGLYANKIRAIVRELSCNAYDAHVAAGKKDVPIEIQLPTTLKPIFQVKDFGTGLSDFQIRGCYRDPNTNKNYSLEEGAELLANSDAHKSLVQEGGLYNTYFDSTKQDSNDFIGALGLGSKSPFSYVSNFLVESRYDGVKTLYTAFINEHHLPAIVKNGEEKTTESNGMTISIAVKHIDTEKFHQEARAALMYFNPLPNVKGASNFEPHSLKHTVVGSNWKVREAGYYSNMRGPYVLQGFVVYPIDVEQLKQHSISKVAESILGVDIDYVVPMGDVEVAASREALSYDPRTIKNLIDVVEKSAAEMRTTIQTELDKCKTLWEATARFNLFLAGDYKFREIVSAMHDRSPFTWNKKAVSSYVGGDGASIKSTMILKVQNQRNGKLYTTGKWIPNAQVKKNEFDVRPSLDTIVYIDDQFKNANAMVFQALNSLSSNKKKSNGYYDNENAIILRSLSKTQYNQTEIDKIVKMLGDPQVVYISTLQKVPTNGTKYVKREKGTVLCWQGFPQNGGYRKNEIRRSFSRLCWNTESVDFDDAGFYVPIERFTIMHDKKEQTAFDILLKHAEIMGLWDKTTPIYGLTEKDMKEIENNSDWVNVFDHIKEAFEQANKNDEYTNLLVTHHLLQYEVNVRYIVEVSGKTLLSKLNDCSFKTIIKKMADTYKVSKTVKPEYIQTVLRIFNNNIDSTSEKKAKTILTELKETTAEYKMLSLVSWQYVHNTQLDIIIDYINMMAKK